MAGSTVSSTTTSSAPYHSPLPLKVGALILSPLSARERPRPTLPTIDPFVVAPPLLDSQGVGTPIPPPISKIAVHPGRIEVETRFPASGGLHAQDRGQGDVANITGHTDMKMMVPVFRVHDHLDDRVFVEVPRIRSVTYPFAHDSGPASSSRAEVRIEVREVTTPVETSGERGSDLSR